MILISKEIFTESCSRFAISQIFLQDLFLVLAIAINFENITKSSMNVYRTSTVLKDKAGLHEEIE